jgi:Protein of unknown function (DUF3040)
MALSMDEQRMLAEIERRLAAEDPGLASCLTTFRRPGPATVLRSPRARIIGSLFTVLVVAMVSLMVYAMIPFRGHALRNCPTPYGPGNCGISATGNKPPSIRAASATTSTSAGSSTEASASNSSVTRASSAAASRTSEPRTKQKNAGTAPSAMP